MFAFKKFGNGNKTMLAFHGFGQDAALFEGWEQYFEEYTIFSVDLFFHGKSTWSEDELLLPPARWRDMLDVFFKEHRIERFSIMAFSLGGRVALTTLHFFAARIDALWLLAPDGIKKNFWYLLSTRLHSVRLLFRWSIDYPEIFLKVKNAASKTGLINKSLAKLAQNQMSERALRSRVYQTWLVYRYFLLRKKRISYLLNTYQIPFNLFAAQFDRLVPPHALSDFCRYVPHARFHLLPCGHFKLPAECLQLLMQEKI